MRWTQSKADTLLRLSLLVAAWFLIFSTIWILECLLCSGAFGVEFFELPSRVQDRLVAAAGGMALAAIWFLSRIFRPRQRATLFATRNQSPT
jgi:hypothetical protein